MNERVVLACSAQALEGKGPQRQPQRRLERRLEDFAKAVAGGYCRLQMPLKLTLAVRRTVAGRRLGALEGGGVPPPLPIHPFLGGGSNQNPATRPWQVLRRLTPGAKALLAYNLGFDLGQADVYELAEVEEPAVGQPVARLEKETPAPPIKARPPEAAMPHPVPEKVCPVPSALCAVPRHKSRHSSASMPCPVLGALPVYGHTLRIGLL